MKILAIESSSSSLLLGLHKKNKFFSLESEYINNTAKNINIQDTYPVRCDECHYIDDNDCDDSYQTLCKDRNLYFIDGSATCSCRDNHIGSGTVAQPCRYCSSIHNCMQRRSGCGGYDPVTFTKNHLISCLSSARNG